MRKKEAKKYSVHIDKGGDAKTTSTVTIGAGLARRGYKTLLIDLDPQASLSANFGLSNEKNTITNTFLNNEKITPIKVSENLYVVPSNRNLAVAESQLINEIDKRPSAKVQ